jgi:hypothetical protein
MIGLSLQHHPHQRIISHTRPHTHIRMLYVTVSLVLLYVAATFALCNASLIPRLTLTRGKQGNNGDDNDNDIDTRSTINNFIDIPLATGTIRLPKGRRSGSSSSMLMTSQGVSVTLRTPRNMDYSVSSANNNDNDDTSTSMVHEQWLVHLKSLSASVLHRINEIIVPYSLSSYVGHETYLLVAPESIAALLWHTHSYIGVLGIVEYHPSLRVHASLHAPSSKHYVVKRTSPHSGTSVPLTLHFGVMLAPPSQAAHSRQRAHQLASLWTLQLARHMNVPASDVSVSVVNEIRVDSPPC